MSVCCECCVLSGEVSVTYWSRVQRSPTDCNASLCVIQKPQEWGSLGPLLGRSATGVREGHILNFLNFKLFSIVNILKCLIISMDFMRELHENKYQLKSNNVLKLTLPMLLRDLLLKDPCISMHKKRKYWRKWNPEGDKDWNVGMYWPHIFQ